MMANYQGGKEYGASKKKAETSLDEINQTFAEDEDYSDVEDLSERLQDYKSRFVEFDRDASGDLDLMEVKYMMEKLGQAKTHLELKKIIAEVDTTNSGTITYFEFVTMMLGKKNSILKRILKFEEMMKEKEIPKGPPRKKSLADLP